MIKLEFDIDASKEDAERFHQIIGALLKCGGLTGVKSGKTIIHFDSYGAFQGVELDYWPFKRRDLNV